MRYMVAMGWARRTITKVRASDGKYAGNAKLHSEPQVAIIAAEQTGRRCYAMELSPQYVDVAVRRWQQFTDQQAILEATGEPFPEDQPA